MRALRYRSLARFTLRSAPVHLALPGQHGGGALTAATAARHDVARGVRAQLFLLAAAAHEYRAWRRRHLPRRVRHALSRLAAGDDLWFARLEPRSAARATGRHFLGLRGCDLHGHDLLGLDDHDPRRWPELPTTRARGALGH